MRLEIMPGINNCTLINDSYNSDLNSIQIALDVLKRQNQHKKKSLIISDILQSGQNASKLYAKLAQIIEKAGLSHIILVGKQLKANAQLIKGKKHIFTDTEELLQSQIIKSFHNEAILIKAARKFEFDKISEALQQKTHRTVLEINMEALAHNLNFYRSKLKPGTKIMAMVKAFSYGSGGHEIAGWLEHHHVDYLGVAYADEGIALRKSGIGLPIMVMNPNFESFRSLIEYNLEPELYSFAALEQFNEIARQNSINAWPVHIKIDTGMKRLGFEAQDIPRLKESLKRLKAIKIKSIFSHLVASDEAAHDKFTNKQITEFKQISKQIAKVLPYDFMHHIVNSSGIERFPDAHFNMVRLGIGLYGISPKNQDKLMNIGTLKTKISQIKTLKAGETVGYNRKGKSLKKTKIAVLPIGYADGLNRKLSNGNGGVFVKGKFAPYIGNICMDMSMIDLSGIEANESDEVIIFGQEIPITKLAEQIGTIPYELLTGISGRVKRVYLY
jgi:alanine racemase